MKAILITAENQSRLAMQWNVDPGTEHDRLPIGYWLLADFGSDNFFTQLPEVFEVMYTVGRELENGYVEIVS